MLSSDVVIIGCGVVGLAIAEELSKKSISVLVLERNASFGMETSSRNSEVIHAGIYYPKNSLKGKLCLQGNKLMYEFCKKYDVPCRNSGKLIVAVDDNQEKMLPELLELAQGNGAEGVRIVDKKEIFEIEPKVTAQSALYCPTSGVVDSHSFMKKLEQLSKERGVMFVYNNSAVGIDKVTDGYVVTVQDKSGELFKLGARVVINSAGLCADKVSEMAGIDVDKAGYRINLLKGIYFRVSKKLELYPKALIYPVPPHPAVVGVHTCPDLYGGMRLGPHCVWVDKLDYSVDDTFHQYFYDSVKGFLPFIEYDDFYPDMCGFLPRIELPGAPMKDFVIQNEVDKGLDNFINLVGIESPGLTSSLAIAQMVGGLVDEVL